jgi:hypothetical protein
MQFANKHSHWRKIASKFTHIISENKNSNNDPYLQLNPSHTLPTSQSYITSTNTTYISEITSIHTMPQTPSSSPIHNTHHPKSPKNEETEGYFLPSFLPSFFPYHCHYTMSRHEQLPYTPSLQNQSPTLQSLKLQRNHNKHKCTTTASPLQARRLTSYLRSLKEDRYERRRRRNQRGRQSGVGEETNGEDRYERRRRRNQRGRQSGVGEETNGEDRAA